MSWLHCTLIIGTEETLIIMHEYYWLVIYMHTYMYLVPELTDQSNQTQCLESRRENSVSCFEWQQSK